MKPNTKEEVLKKEIKKEVDKQFKIKMKDKNLTFFEALILLPVTFIQFLWSALRK